MAVTDDFVKVASVSDVPEGTVKVVQSGIHKVALCNSGGEFYAVADLCSHDNGPLGEGELLDGEIECPRHGARFDIRTGKALCLPAVLPIPTYAVQVRGSEIWLSTTPEIKSK